MLTLKEAQKRLAAGRPVYAEYFEREQVKRRVSAITSHTGGEVTLEHGPEQRIRLGLNRVLLTQS